MTENEHLEENVDGPPPNDAADADQMIAWPIRRYSPSGECTAVNDRLIRERRIELVVNDTPILAMLALPRDVEALALGFLISEGLCRDRREMPEVCFDTESGQVRCTGLFDDDAMEAIHRRWTFGTGCGGGGTGRDPSRLADCRPLDNPVTISAEQLAARGREFGRASSLYRLTGGVHACGIADTESLLFTAEDVGRHNAFDKVAGMAVQRKLDLSDKIALTSGRVSAEIIGKAVAHGVPILASSSAPTAMGVEWARRFGLTVVGFLRGRRMNIYTGYQRVVD